MSDGAADIVTLKQAALETQVVCVRHHYWNAHRDAADFFFFFGLFYSPVWPLTPLKRAPRGRSFTLSPLTLRLQSEPLCSSPHQHIWPTAALCVLLVTNLKAGWEVLLFCRLPTCKLVFVHCFERRGFFRSRNAETSFENISLVCLQHNL